MANVRQAAGLCKELLPTVNEAAPPSPIFTRRGFAQSDRNQPCTGYQTAVQQQSHHRRAISAFRSSRTSLCRRNNFVRRRLPFTAIAHAVGFGARHRSLKSSVSRCEWIYRKSARICKITFMPGCAVN